MKTYQEEGEGREEGETNHSQEEREGVQTLVNRYKKNNNNETLEFLFVADISNKLLHWWGGGREVREREVKGGDLDINECDSFFSKDRTQLSLLSLLDVNGKSECREGRKEMRQLMTHRSETFIGISPR